MRMWPISTRVNKPKNDDPSFSTRLKLATHALRGKNGTSQGTRLSAKLLLKIALL
jgi:hypothetical protein